MKLQVKFSPEPAETIPVKMVGLPSRSLATKAKLNSRITLNRGSANLNLTRLCRRRLNIKSQLALFVAFSLLVITGCKPSGGHAQYETSPAVRGNIIQRVTASGTLSAVVSVDVGSQVSGKISALYVDFNSPVKKGQLVAEIDPTVYQAVMQQAQGDLASARADVTLKGQNLERKKILVPLKAASQLDLDQATAELAQAQATITIKQAVLESAQANLGYCKINAPVDGIVISRDVDLGQTITAGFTTPVLFTIAQDITKMNIKADVSEADIGQVKDGQPVDFTVDAFPDDVFKGTVTQVRKSPTTTQNVVTYQVIISVDNPEQKLFPGMTADVSILAAENDKALKIPNTALRYTPPDNAAYEGAQPGILQRNQHLIYSTSADGMKLKPIVVKTGITDGVNTEILDGLSDGTPVVTSTLAASAKGGGFGGGPPGGGAP
jgi:HlyD family secretion protein